MSATSRSPLSGCAILIAAVLMLVFLIGFSIWIPFRQAEQIEQFTEAEPEPVRSVSPGARPAEARALRERFEAFAESLDEAETEARLALDADELNLAIGMFEPMAELRETFWVEEVREDDLRVSICYQVNGAPRLAKEDEDGLITSDPRYLIGEMIVRPVLSKRELVLEVDELNVEDAEIPEGFMGHFSTLRIFEGLKEDDTVGPRMAKLTRAEVEDGRLVLARMPGEPVPDTVSDEAFQEGGGKIVLFLGGAILLFLLIAGTVLVIGYRAQLRKLQAEEQTNAPGDDA